MSELDANSEPLAQSILDTDKLLTTSQVAALFQVSPITVEMWVGNNVLPSSKMADGQNYYKYSDITKHAEKHNIAIVGDIRQITKVLIVDDDSFVADFLKDFLESREIVYEVQRTSISFMADKLVKSFHPHVVILDLRMPGMNGIELCKMFSSQIEEGLRVFGISGYWSENDRDAFLIAGGECCLDKPLDVKQLIAVLEKNREFGEGYSLHVKID